MREYLINKMNEEEKFFENYQGAFDDRPQEKKDKDYYQKEIVAKVNDIEWKEKKKSEFRSFPSLNQKYTNKCVAFTLRKITGILYWLRTGKWLDFSASFPYEYRVNKPGGGMVGVDAFDIWRKNGMTLEDLCPSTQTYDEDLVAIDEFSKQVAKGFISGGDIGIDPGDFDAVCSTIQTTKKGIMVWFYFTSREWSLEVPKVIDDLSGPGDSRASRHSVSGVDFGIATDVATVNGQQVLKIEDSAHFGGRDVRYITREYFKARNFFVRYPMNFKYAIAESFQVLPITKTLKLGMSGIDVSNLQKMLQDKGYFPVNAQCTGYFGSVTLEAVKKFQKENGLQVDGIVGPKTREKLSTL